MTLDDLADIHARAMTIPEPWTATTINAFATSHGGFLITQAHGFAIGRVVADEAELLTLAVDPNHQKRGQGRALLTEFERHAFENGGRRGFLDVATTNLAARSLYRSCGWQKTGERPGYYRAPDGSRIDAVLLQKSLTGN